MIRWLFILTAAATLVFGIRGFVGVVSGDLSPFALIFVVPIIACAFVTFSAGERRALQCERMIAGEGGWSEWIHPLPGYLMQCCDCGLVHEAQFQISARDGDGPLNPGESDEAGVVVFRMRRA